jgi:hypothetical protein
MTARNNRILVVLALLSTAALASVAYARPRPRFVIVGRNVSFAHGWATRRSLENTLETWCRRARCHLVWRPRHDYRLEARATFRGPFVRALGVLARALALARVPLALRYYRGNRVLVVRRWLP